MFLPQAPSARATPSPLPGRPAILHCAKDRSIPWHTIRIIGYGVVPFLCIPCSYCTVTPLCASVARLVSVALYSIQRSAGRSAARPSLDGALSSRPVAPCTPWCLLFQVILVDRMACARFSTHWATGGSVQPNTQVERGGCRFAPPLCSNTLNIPIESWCARFSGEQAFASSLVRSGGRVGGFHTLRVVTLCAMVFQPCDRRTANYYSHPAAPTVLGSLP